MAYIRKIRTDYFKVYIEKLSSPKTKKAFNLDYLIQKVDKLSISSRNFDYYQEKARLDKIYSEKSTGYWYLNFVRLRQTNLPVIAKEDEEAEGISLTDDEYIGEDTTALYDDKANIFVLQRNRDSLSSSGIESYLNKLYDDSEYKIVLEPILLGNVDEKLRNAKEFRKITFKVDLDSTHKRKIPNNTSLSRFIELMEETDGNNGTISISLGRGRRKKTLDFDTIFRLINDIRESEGLVTGVELSVKYNDTTPVEILDLFSMKCFDVISIRTEKGETIPYKDIAEEMCISYNKRKNKL